MSDSTCHAPRAKALVVRPDRWRGKIPREVESLFTDFLTFAQIREGEYTFTPVRRVHGCPAQQGKVGVVRVDGRCIALTAMPHNHGNDSRYEYLMAVPHGLDIPGLFNLLRRAAERFGYEPDESEVPETARDDRDRGSLPTAALVEARCVDAGVTVESATEVGPAQTVVCRIRNIRNDEEFLPLFLSALYERYGEDVPSGVVAYLRTVEGGFGNYAEGAIKQALTLCVRDELLTRVHKNDNPNRQVVGYRFTKRGHAKRVFESDRASVILGPVVSAQSSPLVMSQQVALAIAPYRRLVAEIEECDCSLAEARLELARLTQRRLLLSQQLEEDGMQHARRVHEAFCAMESSMAALRDKA